MTFEEKVRSRKFILVCCIQIINTIALFTQTLTGSEYVTVTTLTFTSYIGINMYQKGIVNNASNSS